MAEPEPLTLDVRPDLRAGREPLPKILAAVDRLAPGQSLRLLTTFEPLPLYRVLGSKGYVPTARQLGPGDWEVVFAPGEAERPVRTAGQAAPAGGDWPPPAARLDNRGLLPPEPMIRILEKLETLGEGEVLEALNDREPMFLYPELEARGHAVRVERTGDGVRVRIRVGRRPEVHR